MELQRGNKNRLIKIFLVVFIILLIVLGLIYYTFFMNKKTSITNAPLDNPLKSIIEKNTINNNVNQSAVIEQGILEFNGNYINYLLIALGSSSLHKAAISYGNPEVELNLDNEIWSSELGDVFITKKGNSNDPDVRIYISKEDAVKALLSEDIKQYMKGLVSDGKVRIEMVAGNLELLSKGYLDMAKELGYNLGI